MIDSLFDGYSLEIFTPELFLVGLALVLLMADTFLKKLPKRFLGLAGAVCTLLTAFALQDEIYALLAVVATGLTLLLSFDYAKITNASSNESGTQDGTGEFYILPILACAGISAMTKATDLVMLFIGLEVLTLSSYILVGYYRRNYGSVEAGVKYLVLGAVSTGILVFGAAWYFGMTGTFTLSPSVVAATFIVNDGIAAGLMMAATFLILGAAFKIGAVPMHIWIPDVYQGAPTPTTAFLSVASKVAGFALLTILLTPFLSYIGATFGYAHRIYTVLAIVAALSLIIGNLGAIAQTNMKRLLGYSSIAQAGFILPLYLQCGHADFDAPFVPFYLAVYMIATMGAFFALAQVRIQRGSEEISAFRALGKTNPRLAFAITVLFASLAGVPLTGGFFAKLSSFITVTEASGSSHACLMCWLFPIMIICAAAGFYYYFKVIRMMYWETPLEEDKPLRTPVVTGIVLAASVAFLIICGVMPLFTGPLF